VRARLVALLKLVGRRYPLDAAVDGLAARFLAERLPPCPADVPPHAPPPAGWAGGAPAGGGGAALPKRPAPKKTKDRSRKRQRLAANAAAAAATAAAAGAPPTTAAAAGGVPDSADEEACVDADDGPFGYVRPASTVRLAAAGIARLTMDDATGFPVLRHCVTNPRAAAGDGDADGGGGGGGGVAAAESGVLAASPRGLLRVTAEEAVGVDGLLAAYPAAVAVRDVALDDVRDRVQLVRALLEARLLVVVTA